MKTYTMYMDFLNKWDNISKAEKEILRNIKKDYYYGNSCLIIN